MLSDYHGAYRRIRSLHVVPLIAAALAARYALMGDTRQFHTHGGMKSARIRKAPARPRDDGPA